MDEDYLKGIGKIWTSKDFPKDIINNPIIKDIVNSITGLLTNSNPKSVLISGEKGVGKSTLINLISKNLKSKGWHIFITSAGNIMAGQRYIGDLEQNVKNLINELTSGKKILWIVPRFQELYYGGRHEYSPVSILDQILPFIESGALKIIGELDSGNLEKIIQFRPQVQGTFELVRVSSSSKDFTIDLGQDWINLEHNATAWNAFEKNDLEEIYYLSKQYLSYKENPGNLIDLLKQTNKLVESKQTANRSIVVTDVIETLSNVTGLPKNILDDSEKLDIKEIEDYFSQNVIGQEDAIQTLTERIAMIKAGLTDPSKPSAVYLFVGPTGTGKTEIAKSLAEYLFGSQDRLIRLDMSEFQTAESTYKILGDASDVSESSALVNSIRKNPFSVVLLDEFEKAHSNIWDLFLQVFDDGRLTDQRGSKADFRHSIIILTSNLGSAIPTSSKIGFSKSDDEPIDTNILKAVGQTFRPEFVNRIDKIVVFNPLTKSIAKQILKNELKNILKRRGLRRRGWELDFEDSSLEFLLKKGFSDTLGARPLKRAIEKYLLAPLAKTIVNHDFPKGDQFLLVGAGKNKLKVEFIDPDEPEYSWDQKQKILKDQEIKTDKLDLLGIIMDTKGVLSEFKFIQKEFTELNKKLQKNDLDNVKSQLMNQMTGNEFWEDEKRFEVLSEIEFIDRLESAFETLDNLYNRLHDPQKERLNYDIKLIRKLAERIYLLDAAIESHMNNTPQDAILKIEYDVENSKYGDRIIAMYESWVRARGMKMEKVKSMEDSIAYSSVYSVSGFGAFRILQKENGYHVFEEQPKESGKVERFKIKVIVAPMELEDYRAKNKADMLNRINSYSSIKNSRRYILKKSPLVKDLKNNWQTGKIERVLAGDFDLFK